MFIPFLFLEERRVRQQKATLKVLLAALAGVAQWIEHWPANQRVNSLIPIRAHAWGAGQVPSRGHARGNHTLMFLSLFFSLSSLLSKNK